MASSPIISWQIDGRKKNRNSDRLYFLRLQNYCGRYEGKRCLLLGKKVMTNLDSVLKSKHITLTTMIHIIKSYDFSSSHVQM